MLTGFWSTLIMRYTSTLRLLSVANEPQVTKRQRATSNHSCLDDVYPSVKIRTWQWIQFGALAVEIAEKGKKVRAYYEK